MVNEYVTGVTQTDMVTSMVAIADAYATAGTIAATSNLQDTPVWMFSAREDTINFGWMQDADQSFIENYGGNVTMVECATCDHGGPADADTVATYQADMLQFLYENIDGSGIDYDTNLITRTYADDWYENGYL